MQSDYSDYVERKVPATSHKITLSYYLNLLKFLQHTFERTPLEEGRSQRHMFLYLKTVLLACSRNVMLRDDHIKEEQTIIHPFCCIFLKLKKGDTQCMYVPNFKEPFETMIQNSYRHALKDHPHLFPHSKDDLEDPGCEESDHTACLNMQSRIIENLSALAKNYHSCLEGMALTLKVLGSTTESMHTAFADVLNTLKRQGDDIKDLKNELMRVKEGSPFWKDSDTI